MLNPDPAASPEAGPVGYDPAGRPVRPTDTAPAAENATHGIPAYGTDAQQAVRQWIVENQTLAVLAGFALGVFIGVLMRK